MLAMLLHGYAPDRLQFNSILVEQFLFFYFCLVKEDRQLVIILNSNGNTVYK